MAPGPWLLVLDSWPLWLLVFNAYPMQRRFLAAYYIYIWVRWERGQVGISESSSGGAGGNLEIRKSANLEMGKSAYIYPSCRRVGSHFAIGP